MFRTLEWLTNNEDYAKIWTRPHLDTVYYLMTPIESHIVQGFSNLYYFLLKMHLGAEDVPAELRWIDYPASRSPADSFVMAGPI